MNNNVSLAFSPPLLSQLILYRKSGEYAIMQVRKKSRIQSLLARPIDSHTRRLTRKRLLQAKRGNVQITGKTTAIAFLIKKATQKKPITILLFFFPNHYLIGEPNGRHFPTATTRVSCACLEHAPTNATVGKAHPAERRADSGEQNQPSLFLFFSLLSNLNLIFQNHRKSHLPPLWVRPGTHFFFPRTLSDPLPLWPCASADYFQRLLVYSPS